MNKYNNKIVEYKNIKFHSQMELDFYLHLLKLKEEGVVKEIILQPKFELQPAYVKNGRKVRRIDYVGDFHVIYADGKEEVIDVKGQELPLFLLKKKILEYKYPFELKTVTMSKIDGGFIELSELKKARKERKKLKDINKSNKI